MYLNFQIIVDLIINTIKNCFLDEELNIEEVKPNKKNEYCPIKLMISTGDDGSRKYQIRLFSKPKENNKARSIYGVDMVVLYKADEIPLVIGSFTAQAIMELESITRVLNGCYFYTDELEGLENEKD